MGVGALAFVVVACQNATAQRPNHFTPARQTFSPYLLYNQVNSTGIPNYYTYVQPATQFRDFVNQIPPETRRAPRQPLVNERAVARILDQQLRERATTGIGAASVPASFGNRSHYYTAPRRARR